MTSSTSQPSPLPPPSPSPPLLITSTKLEHEREEEDAAVHNTTPQPRQQKKQQQEPPTVTPPPEKPSNYQHRPTPLHSSVATADKTTKRINNNPPTADHVVSFNKCRPTSARDKISVAPHPSATAPLPSPNRNNNNNNNNNIFKSLFSSLAKQSPRPSSSSAVPPLPDLSAAAGEWKVAAAELSLKLLAATRQRDEALLETSRLKDSLSDLEKKLTKLETYCHSLKSALDNHHLRPFSAVTAAPIIPGGRIFDDYFSLETFLRAVSESRSAVRLLSRSLAEQVPAVAARRDYHHPKSLHLFHLEAQLTRVFYEDFESTGFEKGGPDRVLDPRGRAKANMASYVALRGLTWEEVLSSGTRHYSEGFSRFCDQKMSGVVAAGLGGGGGGRGSWGSKGMWPEPLLQAFFGAAKAVWLVHLLSWTAHPAVPIFRVEKGTLFDAGYMEDAAVAAGDRQRRMAPAAVRMMVAPGFYVGDSVVKCKVLCTFHNKNINVSNSGGGSKQR